MKPILHLTVLVATGPWLLLAGEENDSKESEELSFWDMFVDEEDGAVDLSEWFDSPAGFLPIPLIVTEPAVGVGGGLALLYFHGREEDEKDNPPSISGIAGLYTTNGSWVTAGFHQGIWRDDSIRYLGVVGAAALNLKFYGQGEAGKFEDNPLEYNLDAFFLLQEMRFRMMESDFFLGGGYIFSTINTTFDVGQIIPGLPQETERTRQGGLELIGSYDSRDNIFTPNSGIDAEVKFSHFDTWLGGDNIFDRLDAKMLNYWDVHEDWVLALRLDGRIASGDVPFFLLPFVDMRGIPAMRYLDEITLLGEGEARWNVFKRWWLVGFTGLARAGSDFNDLADQENLYTFGGGFRYLLARKYNLLAGLDVARGPEDTVVYLTIGNAW